MNMHKIELPPLPPLHIVPSVEPVDYPEVAQVLLDYARAAVAADRQRRGEPVGYIMPTALKQLKAGGHAVVGGVSQGFDVPIYAAPQPAEPMKVNAIFETENGEVIGTTDAKVKRVEWQDDGSLTVVIDYWPQPAEPISKDSDDFFTNDTPKLRGLNKPVKVPSEDERAAQGLPPYNPRHPTEEEWNRLTENGCRAWGEAAPKFGEDLWTG